MSPEHFDAVIHFAGLKAVGESSTQPMTYYENNVVGTMRLVSAMSRADVKMRIPLDVAQHSEMISPTIPI